MELLQEAMLQAFVRFEVAFSPLNRTDDGFLRDHLEQKVGSLLFCPPYTRSDLNIMHLE